MWTVNFTLDYHPERLVVMYIYIYIHIYRHDHLYGIETSIFEYADSMEQSGLRYKYGDGTSMPADEYELGTPCGDRLYEVERLYLDYSYAVENSNLD